MAWGDVVFSASVKINSVCPAVKQPAEKKLGKKKSACK